MKLIPKKQFSQNFLINVGIQDKIVQTFSHLVDDNTFSILEIGPGRGDVTKHLLRLERELFCLELDQESISFLKNHEEFHAAKIQYADALIELEKESSELIPTHFNLFSSLPYATGSRMLVALGLNYPTTPFGVIVQREVAQKTQLTDKKITLFGIWLNLFWDLKLEFNISPGNFYPAPKVTSSFLTARPKSVIPSFLNTSPQRQKVLKLLKNLVACPNKTLANNLKLIIADKEKVFEFLSKIGMNEKTRLSSTNYLTVLKSLTEMGY
jgi:16S rRNA (adenine1518-N6/adenine1519-N6)-dimethyltransferase